VPYQEQYESARPFKNATEGEDLEWQGGGEPGRKGKDHINRGIHKGINAFGKKNSKTQEKKIMSTWRNSRKGNLNGQGKPWALAFNNAPPDPP